MSAQKPGLRLVLQDGSVPVAGPALAPYAQSISFAQYEDGEVPFQLFRANGDPANAAGGAFILTYRFNSFDADPPPLSRQGTSIDFSIGIGKFILGEADTAIEEKIYRGDVDYIDAAGKRWQVMPPSDCPITEAIGIPGTPVTQPASFPPLGQGDSIRWRGIYDPVAAYKPLDAVSFVDTDGTLSSFICTFSTTGNDPTDNAFWDLMAEGVAGPAPPGGSNGDFIVRVGGVATWQHTSAFPATSSINGFMPKDDKAFVDNAHGVGTPADLTLGPGSALVAKKSTLKGGSALATSNAAGAIAELEGGAGDGAGIGAEAHVDGGLDGSGGGRQAAVIGGKGGPVKVGLPGALLQFGPPPSYFSDDIPIASASTISPADFYSTVSGSAAIQTINDPAPTFKGILIFLPAVGATWTFAAGGNMAAASVGFGCTPGVPVVVLKDSITSKWYVVSGGTTGSGGGTVSVPRQASPYTANYGDLVPVDTTVAPVVITLPKASLKKDGLVDVVNDTNSDNYVIVRPNGTIPDRIIGSGDYFLLARRSAASFKSDGVSNWWLLNDRAQFRPTTIKSSNYSPAYWETVRLDSSAGAISITLPSAADAGKQIKLVLLTGGNVVVPVPMNGETVQLGVNVDLNDTGDVLLLEADGGNNWMAVG